jgi:hypothetical protein
LGGVLLPPEHLVVAVVHVGLLQKFQVLHLLVFLFHVEKEPEFHHRVVQSEFIVQGFGLEILIVNFFHEIFFDSKDHFEHVLHGQTVVLVHVHQFENQVQFPIILHPREHCQRDQKIVDIHRVIVLIIKPLK